ncbi:hypothetical protein AHAS_Ahas19G0073400 [Arachis hypogaea]
MQHAGNIAVHRFDRRNEEPTLLLTNPTLRRRSKGHPKLTRYLNEMDSRNMRGSRICRLCGAQGHSRSRCPQRAGASGVGDNELLPHGNWYISAGGRDCLDMGAIHGSRSHVQTNNKLRGPSISLVSYRDARYSAL